MEDLHEDPQVAHSSSLQDWDSGTPLGRVRLPRHAPLFRESPVGVAGPTPGLGQHTKEVLAELGYDDGAVEGMEAAGVLGPASE